jgi:hypothetical protein
MGGGCLIVPRFATDALTTTAASGALQNKAPKNKRPICIGLKNKRPTFVGLEV